MDHPRSRGVYHEFRGLFGWKNGSSPLARGLQARDVSIINAIRIIPARAGFTGRRRHDATLAEDHPRSRGVYLADPWNPNEPTLYQAPAAFTADLGPAPPGRDSAVEFGAALSTAGRAGRDLAAAGLRPWFGHPPDTHRRVATTSG